MDEYKFADAASAVLAAAREQRKTAEDCLEALGNAIGQFNDRSHRMTGEVKKDMHDVLKGAVDNAAKELGSHFAEADVAADNAAAAYRRAEARVGWKIILALVAMGAIIMGAMTIWMTHVLPNESKIAQLRAEEGQLKASMIELGGEERRLKASVASLVKRGGGAKIDITTCADANGVIYPCVRVDETAPELAPGYRALPRR